MSIHYGIRFWSRSGEIVEAATTDHCFGNLRNFPDLEYESSRSSSSSIICAESSHFSDLSEQLHEIVLYTDHGFNSEVWDSQNEFLEHMEDVVSDIPWMRNIKVRKGSKEIAYMVKSDTTWDELILHLTFFRNLMCYNPALTYKKFLDEGLRHRHASILSQIVLQSGSHGSPYVENDEEYSWLCPISLGEKAFSKLLTDEGPDGYTQKVIMGGGDGGYLRDEDYSDEGEIFNESADSDWGEESNYYMMLCRTYCLVNDSPLPFTNSHVRESSGEITMDVGGWKIKNIVTGFDNWFDTYSV